MWPSFLLVSAFAKPLPTLFTVKPFPLLCHAEQGPPQDRLRESPRRRNGRPRRVLHFAEDRLPWVLRVDDMTRVLKAPPRCGGARNRRFWQTMVSPEPEHTGRRATRNRHDREFHPALRISQCAVTLVALRAKPRFAVSTRSEPAGCREGRAWSWHKLTRVATQCIAKTPVSRKNRDRTDRGGDHTACATMWQTPSSLESVLVPRVQCRQSLLRLTRIHGASCHSPAR